ncbi:phospholipase A1-like [Pectinophora gossypiella]|uniref:phospholipase A1-like n=1 Tax=Pectinophora gossypiella TaxID=13191 RepID=UPI00214E0F77|nr:phospholipase A1-like [Pectinophora gossypiella]
MQASLLVFSLIYFATGLCDDNNDAKIRYYYGNFDEYTELPITEADQIFKKDWYNSSRTTVMFAHGFTGRPEGPAVTAVIKAYLGQNNSNVALLNWEHMAAIVPPGLVRSYVNWAAPNARKLGVRIADTLRNLSSAGLNLNQTHFIGHSLGAHIFGIAGNHLMQKGIQLPWITGLDPAGVGFENRVPLERLNPGSAGYVFVLHTDPNKYGFSRPLGSVDFWPNYRNLGPVRQPGCDYGPRPQFTPEDLCSHNRCWQLLVDSVKYPGTLLGSYARNYRTWKNYSPQERNEFVLEVGKSYKKFVSGNYYFVTKDVSPYGLGKNGL